MRSTNPVMNVSIALSKPVTTLTAPAPTVAPAVSGAAGAPTPDAVSPAVAVMPSQAANCGKLIKWPIALPAALVTERIAIVTSTSPANASSPTWTLPVAKSTPCGTVQMSWPNPITSAASPVKRPATGTSLPPSSASRTALSGSSCQRFSRNCSVSAPADSTQPGSAAPAAASGPPVARATGSLARVRASARATAWLPALRWSARIAAGDDGWGRVGCGVSGARRSGRSSNRCSIAGRTRAGCRWLAGCRGRLPGDQTERRLARCRHERLAEPGRAPDARDPMPAVAGQQRHARVQSKSAGFADEPKPGRSGATPPIRSRYGSQSHDAVGTPCT